MTQSIKADQRYLKKRRTRKEAHRQAKIHFKNRGKATVYELFKTIHQLFPNLIEDIRRTVEDCRKKI